MIVFLIIMRHKVAMHSAKRENIILDLLTTHGFSSTSELERQIKASPATIRRDLERLEKSGRLARVRGGAKAVMNVAGKLTTETGRLGGIPFHENISLNRQQKALIGKAAATLCESGEAIMIDGGSTTLQMCPHLAGLNLQVLTNSLHIVSALIGQPETRVMVPAGAVFAEQSIILSVSDEEGMPNFHAPKLFMGAGALGPQGLMQPDFILMTAERRLIERADELIVLVDATKFESAWGNVVCSLDDIDIVVTDDRISDRHTTMLEAAGIRIIIAPAE